VIEATLLALEEQGVRAPTSGDAADFYRQCLTDDALMVVPGFVVDKQTFLEGIEQEGPWSTFRIDDPRVIELTPSCAVVLYRGTGRRAGQPEYVALMSSVYVHRGGAWRLAYHQQTPFPRS
jgi:hypothetical protein